MVPLFLKNVLGTHILSLLTFTTYVRNRHFSKKFPSPHSETQDGLNQKKGRIKIQEKRDHECNEDLWNHRVFRDHKRKLSAPNFSRRGHRNERPYNSRVYANERATPVRETLRKFYTILNACLLSRRIVLLSTNT